MGGARCGPTDSWVGRSSKGWLKVNKVILIILRTLENIDEQN